MSQREKFYARQKAAINQIYTTPSQKLERYINVILDHWSNRWVGEGGFPETTT